jgi:hypothetical protein
VIRANFQKKLLYQIHKEPVMIHNQYARAITSLGPICGFPLIPAKYEDADSAGSGKESRYLELIQMPYQVSSILAGDDSQDLGSPRLQAREDSVRAAVDAVNERAGENIRLYLGDETERG